MKTFYCFGQRFKITLLAAGNIEVFKKSLAYQHGIEPGGNYVCLCGRNTITADVYVLEKSRVVEYPESYTPEEIKVLVKFLKASLNHIKIPRLTEILVRSLRDRELVSYFYGDLLIKREKWNKRIQVLIDNPLALDTISLPCPARFDRHKYSIYQLLRDLKKYKAEICINEDILDYEKITTSDRSLRDSDGFMFGKVCDVVGNKRRANLSLMIKSGEDYSTFCFIRDGKPHLTEFFVKTENPYLKKKLYGARVVLGSVVFKDVLHLKIDRLPVISRRFLRVKGEDIVSSLVNEKVQELGMKRVDIPKSEKVKAKEYKEVGSRDLFDYCEVSTKLLGKRFDELVEKDITTLDYKTRKKELKKAKGKRNDLIFRYLLTKQPKTGIFEGRGKYKAEIRINDRT